MIPESQGRSRKSAARKSACAFAPLQLDANSIVGAEAVRAITQAIAAERLRPGDRLPAERELARMLGISRSSLRDALKVLDGMGVVNIRRGAGVFVAHAQDPEIASRRAVGTLLLQRGPIAELFEIREVLETQAAGWAAKRASATDTRRMRAAYAELRDCAAAGELTAEEVSRRDSELHRLIARATGNSVLVRIMDGLRGLLDQSRGRTLVVPGRIGKSTEEMGRIIAAIARGDDATAQREMFAHLKHGEEAHAAGASAPSVRARNKESESGRKGAGKGRKR